MKNVKRVLAMVLALVLCFCLLSGCGDKPAETTPAATQQGGNTNPTDAPTPAHEVRSDLNIALTDAPVTNDPHGNSKDMTQQLSHWINDGLILVEGDGTIKPGKMSADGLTYTFTIRDGVKFHNGDPVTPEDVVWSIERCTDMAYYKNYTASFTDVKKTGDKEVTITLKSPDNALLYNLYRIKILSQKRVYEIEGITAVPKLEDFADKTDADGKTITAKDQWKEAYYVKKPKTFGNVAEDAGCGPFVIKSYDKDRLIELEKFADYYDIANTGNIETVKINIITENSTRYNALLTGNLDLVQVPSANWEEIVANGKFNTLAMESATICTMIVNHFREGSPLGDKRVRQAIRYALNREAIIKSAAKGMGAVAYTLYNPKYIIGSSNVNEGTYEYNVQKAKELLAEAGYPNGFTLEQKFLVPKTGDSVAVAQVIQSMLKAVGIIVEIDQKDSSTASTESKNGTQDLYLTNSNYVFHMSDGSRAMHSRTIKTQVAKYAWLPNNEGETLDRLYDSAQAATNDAERDKLYEELNVWLNDQSINIPIYYHVKGFAWDKNLDADLTNPYYLYIQYWNWK